jgi:hypothetical protein
MSDSRNSVPHSEGLNHEYRKHEPFRENARNCAWLPVRASISPSVNRDPWQLPESWLHDLPTRFSGLCSPCLQHSQKAQKNAGFELHPECRLKGFHGREQNKRGRVPKVGTDNQPGPSSLFFETKCKVNVRCPRRKPGAERVMSGKLSPFGFLGHVTGTQDAPSSAREAPLGCA